MCRNTGILIALSLLCGSVAPTALAGQALDTSVTIQVRTRRAATGKTTVTAAIVKLPAPVTVSRVDTVRVVVHDSIGYPVDHYAKYFVWKPIFKVDTLRLFLDTSASSGAYPVGFPAYGLTCQNPTPVPHP